MPATVTVKGKKKVIGKAIPVLKKQGESSAKEIYKMVAVARKSHERRTAQIRAVLANADKQLAELTKDAQTTADQVRFIEDIDQSMTKVWAKWYEQGEKKNDEKAIKHADAEVAKAEKRALWIVKDIKDRVATFGAQLEKHEAAVKGVMDKLW